MEKDFDTILDRCLKLVMEGESIENVLNEYSDVRDDLEPLLRMAVNVSHLPKIEPSEEYINKSKINLLREIRASKSEERFGFDMLALQNRFSSTFRDFWQSFSAPKKWSVAVAAVLVVVLVATLGQFVFFKPSPAMASTCVLQVLSGEVYISDSDSNIFEPSSDRMILEMDMQVKTSSDSYALITFNDGSTTELEPETILEITHLETNEEGSPVIVLSQLVGRTWSSVEKMTDADSRFEINTPSATAVVHGTLFTTEVSEQGETTVSTTEGLVSVTADDEEVFVAANQQTKVFKGKRPSQPQNIPEPESEISINITGLVASSLVDPTGSSTGILPDGTEFNQIPSSKSVLYDVDTQVITISNPKNGNYKIALRFLHENNITYSIQGKLKGEKVLYFKDTLDPEQGRNYVLDFNLKVTEESIEIGKFMIKPMGGNGPEKALNDREDKENPAGKNITENVTDNNTKGEKPDKSEEKNNPGKPDINIHSDNRSNNNQSNNDK